MNLDMFRVGHRFGFLVILVALNCDVGAMQDRPLDRSVADGVQENISHFDFDKAPLGELPEPWALKGMDGFTATVSHGQSRSGRQSLLLESQISESEGKPVGAVHFLPDLKQLRGKRVRFRALAQGQFSEGGQAMLWLREDLKSGGYGAFDNMADRPIGTGSWKEHTIVADISNDAKAVAVGVIFVGQGTLNLDDVIVEVVDESIKRTDLANGAAALGIDAQPGLFEIVGSMEVRAIPGKIVNDEEDVRIVIPLPLLHQSQIPLTYNLKAHPAESLAKVKIYENKPGNYVAEVTLAKVKSHGEVAINFQSMVLVSPSRFGDVPESAKVPEAWPEITRPWLKSTWCVESDHERIRAIADEIREETDDVLAIVERVEIVSKRIIQSATGTVNQLTAVEALDHRGSCTSCGNLVAALLRACNVPARVLAGYPSWSGPLQTHYIVEAYIPGFGWYPIESTLSKSPWPNQNQINVSIIPPEYESEELAGARTGIAGGVPYLSLTEILDNRGRYLTVGTIPEKPGCDHECRVIRKLESDDVGWNAAADWAALRWNKWLKSNVQVNGGEIQFGPQALDTDSLELDDVINELNQ